jgi:PAS domain S-box-containing protein
MAVSRRGSVAVVSTRYGAAVLAILAAFLLHEAFVSGLGPEFPSYVTFYPAVMIVALFGGFGPGVAATLTAAALTEFWTVVPGHGVAVRDPAESAGQVLFVAVGLFMSGVSEWHRRTRARALDLERRLGRQVADEAIRQNEARVREEGRASLEREKAVFQAVVDGARNSHLVYLDREFNFVRVNEAYAATCGYTPEAMVGRNHFALYPDEENEAIFRGVRDSGQSVEFHDKPFVFPDQPERGITYWDWTLLPVKDADGRVDGLVLSLVETTERKRSEQALLDADRRKSEFLATLSHELRNPLAPIRFALDLLGRQPDPDARGHALDVIDRQLRHLVRLVDDLLDVTRIASNKLQLRKQAVQLSDIVRQALEAALPNIERAGHGLIVPPYPEGAWVDGDPDRLVQVVTNLLNNAAKFTPPGGQITVTAGASDREVTIAVADTGVGLRPEDLSRVFDMFTQVNDAGFGGLGIGLSLVRGTVELHGGSVTARSDGPGLGSEFTVRLPRVQAPESPRPDAGEVPDGPPRRILVVDDNADAADMMRTLLELLGHQVRVAYDGFAALAVAIDFRPDIGLFDIGLPSMDGFELARRIRADPRTQSIFLVAVTGWGQEEDRQRSRDHGFDAHLTKPADPDAVRRLVAGASRTPASPPVNGR